MNTITTPCYIGDGVGGYIVKRTAVQQDPMCNGTGLDGIAINLVGAGASKMDAIPVRPHHRVYRVVGYIGQIRIVQEYTVGIAGDIRIIKDVVLGVDDIEQYAHTNIGTGTGDRMIVDGVAINPVATGSAAFTT